MSPLRGKSRIHAVDLLKHQKNNATKASDERQTHHRWSRIEFPMDCDELTHFLFVIFHFFASLLKRRLWSIATFMYYLILACCSLNWLILFCYQLGAELKLSIMMSCFVLGQGINSQQLALVSSEISNLMFYFDFHTLRNILGDWFLSTTFGFAFGLIIRV